MENLKELQQKKEKLYDERAKEMHHLYHVEGLTQEEIGKKYNLTKARVGKILKSKRIKKGDL